jgi:hypothetical protein
MRRWADAHLTRLRLALLSCQSYASQLSKLPECVEPDWLQKLEEED